MFPSSAPPVKHAHRHTHLEDAQAIVTAAAFVSLGLAFLRSHQLLTGGTAGMALLLTRVTPLIQMGIDAGIVVAGFFIVSLQTLTLSILGALALNVVLAVNHRPGRYLGTG
jgi:uncharacterized membrane-anchored protein YitT (DUF2179 family)